MAPNQQVQDEETACQYGECSEGGSSPVSALVMPVAVPRAPQPIFAFVNPPLIKDISREALLEWINLRKEFVAVTEARCEAAKEGAKAVLRSVRNSFDESLLETMCETRWDVNKDDLTANFLMLKIKEITTSFMNKELPDMEDMFGDDLKFDESISDVEARVTAYFNLANKIIMRNGVSELFVGDEGVKRKCKVLVKLLPASLHKAVSNELEYRCGEAKLSVRKLYTVVSERALEM
ncbi:hypothetical protein PF005_g29336 [Phytophthora fragariae]|uniref:Uncharacterized protein n=1 Tax=Phytophthora fragariae TaxID=53985 RepID=A0A6A3VIX1_9STRA|nr:hypothetical protein PF009_g29758 [Phytophthora fragariae]KAE8965811.1 hypothetical protein PF011_g28153 [Phytophthora fragariae]KAE9064300.1 hypothetical protein PF010_g28664 [Phytophthora fragariae]KAE9064455.1 hypothetical protein PF007_g29194 [Phytophthora fragariae]KAE9071933.1 hypothetical protein PF006_g29048 [Phytophthora fragariae]